MTVVKDERNRAANTKAVNKPKTVAKIKGLSATPRSMGELSIMITANATSMASNRAVKVAVKGPGIRSEADLFPRLLAFLIFLLLEFPFPDLGRIFVAVAQLEQCSSYTSQVAGISCFFPQILQRAFLILVNGLFHTAFMHFAVRKVCDVW